MMTVPFYDMLGGNTKQYHISVVKLATYCYFQCLLVLMSAIREVWSAEVVSIFGPFITP